MTSPVADFVVSLGTDGQIASQGSVSDALVQNSTLIEEVAHEEELVELDEHEVEAHSETTDDDAAGKLVLAEEIEEGHVSRGACK